MSSLSVQSVCKLNQRQIIYDITSNHDSICFTTLHEIYEHRNNTNTNQIYSQNKDTENRLNPRAFVNDRQGNLYICNFHGNRIEKWNIESKQRSVFAGSGEIGHQDGVLSTCSFRKPAVITMDKNGDLYVGEAGAIRKINVQKKTVETIAGCGVIGFQDGRSHEARFGEIKGIAIDSDNTIYVTDADYNCIRQIRCGYVSTISGSRLKGSSDGYGQTATFSQPKGLLLHKKYLFVADSANSSIRKIDIAGFGFVSTLPLKEKIEFPACLALSDDQLFIYIGAYGEVFRFPAPGWKWMIVKLLWIGQMKESSEYCHLAWLPRPILLEIAKYL